MADRRDHPPVDKRSLLREFTTAELQEELKRRRRTEELLADDEMWDAIQPRLDR